MNKRRIGRGGWLMSRETIYLYLNLFVHLFLARWWREAVLLTLDPRWAVKQFCVNAKAQALQDDRCVLLIPLETRGDQTEWMSRFVAAKVPEAIELISDALHLAEAHVVARNEHMEWWRGVQTEWVMRERGRGGALAAWRRWSTQVCQLALRTALNWRAFGAPRRGRAAGRRVAPPVAAGARGRAAHGARESRGLRRAAAPLARDAVGGGGGAARQSRPVARDGSPPRARRTTGAAARGRATASASRARGARRAPGSAAARARERPAAGKRPRRGAAGGGGGRGGGARCAAAARIELSARARALKTRGAA
ncbi:polyketide synthase [Gracilaria domingensis]|nr:polyketide synthase [Gracilaria domingensis]